ncbi:RNA polymerase sigma factor [Cellulomonas gelida]|uniref:RNA polymerase sigma factor n=1 Tax=Cellulomonas gelida TaxID=1712 RepID=A0A4Y3KH57_9CELL|nr:sigma-70 family RNA polymerase sigma factor [Cellulomonas gelida]GEA83729.1 hypothetical protein CGE01nite_09800 [Cellulomonas gelida]GGL31668.1 hypothetical protein GCM10009774_22680 [Cellulomonas gelida]
MRDDDADRLLADLVHRRGPALVGYAHLLCGDRAAAQDVVQDALVRVFGRLRRGFTPDSAEAYVRRAVLTVFLDERRSSARFDRVRHVVATPDEAAAPGESDDRLDLRRALDVLGRQHRAAVVLRYYDDLTVPEVAARLGVAVGTAKRYLHDALRLLEDELGPLDADDEVTPVVARRAPAGPRPGRDLDPSPRARPQTGPQTSPPARPDGGAR